VTRLIASLLIAESLFTGVRVAGLIPQLSTYDATALALILARGLLGALQFMGGWVLATRRPQGVPIARWGLIGGALLTPLDVGLGLAPTPIYAWLRWQATAVYVAYALGAAVYLGRPRQ
jgi:hypothetical protein